MAQRKRKSSPRKRIPKHEVPVQRWRLSDLAGGALARDPLATPRDDLPLFAPNADEMRALDEAAIALGQPSLSLMEHAGRAVADWVQELTHGLKASVAVVCGPGNNGGDGLVVARLLRQRKTLGNDVVVYLVAASRYSEECRLQLERALKARVEVHVVLGAGGATAQGMLGEPFTGMPEWMDELLRSRKVHALSSQSFAQRIEEGDIVIDALLGTGQKSAPQGTIALAVHGIRRARAQGATVFSIDIPTGADSSEGQVFEPAVEADATLAIECVKRGMLQYPARSACGHLAVAPIGIVERAGAHVVEPQFAVLRGQDAARFLPTRAEQAHKGHFSRLLVVGGSRAMPGAPVLAASAALAVGAPLVSMTSVQSGPAVPVPPEIMHVSFTEDPDLAWGAEIEAWISKHAGVMVLGPGLGARPGLEALVREIIVSFQAADARAQARGDSARVPAPGLVIDADGLNALSRLLQAGLRVALPFAVLTPHPGEMARLLGALSWKGAGYPVTAKDVQSSRYEAAIFLSSVLRTTVVLKGASTLVVSGAQGDVRGFVNLSGTPWMATGGTGDVLAGMVAGFLAQGCSPAGAAAAGVFAHGRAGEVASAWHVPRPEGERSSLSPSLLSPELLPGHPIRATDLISAIPCVLADSFPRDASTLMGHEGPHQSPHQSQKVR